MAAPDLEEFLGVVHRRGDLLAALGNWELTKPEMEAELDVSRSTIDRGVRELESRSLIERVDDGYRQTLAGNLARQEYEGFSRRSDGIREGAELLTALSPDVAFDPAMLEGATVVESERSSPHRPVEALYEVVASAPSVRGFTPAVHPQQVATYQKQARQGMDVELVLTDAVIERLISSYAEAFQGAAENDDVTVFETAGELPYSLTIAQTGDGPVAAVMVYADDGIRGCVINDAEGAVEWAERRYEVEREQAEPIA